MHEDLSHARWRKSSFSGNTGNCVEVAQNVPGIVALRDSKDPDGPRLIFTLEGWRSFAARVRAGEFDLG